MVVLGLIAIVGAMFVNHNAVAQLSRGFVNDFVVDGLIRAFKQFELKEDVGTSTQQAGFAMIWPADDTLYFRDDSTGIVTDLGAAGGGGDPDQNIYETFTGDSGSTTANTTTDSLAVVGGTNITTSVTSDTVTINLNQLTAADISIALGGGSPTIDQVQEYFDNTGSSGFFLGGALSDGGSGTLDVAAGSGFIRTTNDDNAELQSFKWTASSTIAVADNTTQYVYVDDSGVISLSTSEFLETPDKILIGVVTDEGAAIESVFALGVRLEESIGHAGRFMRGVHGIVRNKRVGGLIFGQSGDANRDVTMTAGQLEWGRTSYTMSDFNTSGADTFTTYSASGQEAATASQWPNTQYDNAGTLTTMTNNSKWANLFFWLEPNDKIIMVYGRAEFNSEAGAEAEDVPSSSLPTRISETGLLATRFTFQKSANTADIESAFDTLFANAAVSDHNNLASLQGGTASEYYHTTSAQNTVIGNTSGTNTGDNTVATSGDAAVDFFGAGIDAVTDTTTCTDIEGTGLSITAGVLNATAHTPEGTAVLSTGEGGGSKFLREDGDNTCSWVAIPGGGDALTSNPLSQFASTTSLQFIGVISDETGTGLLVFNNGPTLIAPILGTPASGVATNLTGTASGLTAGNVTTNANLTGPITSAGNATSIASQTGTGTKFVVDTSPTLVTPVLGVATATTINKVTITAPATAATITATDGTTTTLSGGTHSGTNTGDNTVATSGDAALDFFGASVTAVTDATACTDIEGTLLSIAGGTLNAAVNTADIGDVSVTQTEFSQLQTLAATTMSANQWAAIGGMAETIASAEIDLLDGRTGILVTDVTECTDLEGTALSITTGTLNVTEADPTVDTDDKIIAIINVSPSTQIKHEAGGLEADVNGYDGLIGITGGATFNQTGTTTQIIIFDGAGAPTSVALSGNVSMTNGGVVSVNSVQANSVDSDAYVDGSIDLAHMSSQSVDSDNIVDATVAIADLANGTDGELITWSATGVAETVAVGTVDHVLTSNGVGLAPTFQVAPGASGGDPDQNLWETVAGDTGSTAANIVTDTLTIAGGTGLTSVMSGDTLTINAEVRIFKAKIAFEDPVAGDDFFFDELQEAVTFTSIYAKTLVGTVDFDITIGGVDINGTDITANTTGVLDSSLGGDTAGAVGEEVKLEITSVASAPTYIMIVLTGTYDD